MERVRIIGIVIIILLLHSCIPEEENEFIGLIDPDKGNPLAFLDVKVEEPSNRSSGTIDASLVTFGSEYTDIKEWGELKLAQKGVSLIEPEDNALIDVLIRSRKGGRQVAFIPVDTRIGPLMDNRNTSFVDNKIYELIDRFFLLMKEQELDKKLSSVVVASEIPIISRQIIRSSEYGESITKVRVGKIKTVDTNNRSAAVRIIAKKHDASARTKMQFYFLSIDGDWKINAIEGDFNQLKNNYISPGEFAPQGTTGVTQGF